MNTYRIEFKIKSPLITPIMGDTLFGHLCWGIYYHEGDEKIEKFLLKYDETPPLVISNGFPHDKLPIPLLEPVKPKFDIDFSELQGIKKIRKIKYIDLSYFLEEKEFSENKIIKYLKNSNDNIYSKSKNALTYHNTINRFTNTTLQNGGGFFHSDETWFDGNYIVDIYVKTIFDIEKIKKYFSWAIEFGYGADKSIGKGNLEISSIKSINFPKNGNRAMSLGSFIPESKDDFINLRADIFTKYGKLGGNYVYEKTNPFKKPIILYKEGASFSCKNNVEYVGSMINNIHADSKIKHHAYSPIIYFNEVKND